MSRTLQVEGCEQHAAALILNESKDTLLAGFKAAWPLMHALMVSSNVDFLEMLPWELKRTSAQRLQQTTLLSLTGWPQQKKQKVASAADDVRHLQLYDLSAVDGQLDGSRLGLVFGLYAICGWAAILMAS